MRIRRTIRIVLAVCLCWGLTGCATRILKTTEFGAPDLPKRVLVAADATDFKTRVIEQVRTAFSGEPVYFKLIDVRNLEEETADDYDAVVLLNTCLAWSINSNVKEFVRATPETRKIFVITTAADDAWEPDITGVDAMTSASNPDQTDRLADIIEQRIRAKL